jgi:hypothetical protein
MVDLVLGVDIDADDLEVAADLGPTLVAVDGGAGCGHDENSFRYPGIQAT